MGLALLSAPHLLQNLEMRHAAKEASRSYATGIRSPSRFALLKPQTLHVTKQRREGLAGEGIALLFSVEAYTWVGHVLVAINPSNG